MDLQDLRGFATYKEITISLAGKFISKKIYELHACFEDQAYFKF